MSKRYTPKEILNGLQRQLLVQCDQSAERRLVRVSRILFARPREVLIEQGDSTDDIFFILHGSVEVIVNGTRVATRHAGQHVGEIASLLHSHRTATVVSLEETTLAKVGSKKFLSIAEVCPVLLKNMAIELATRLHQRRNLLREPNTKPFIFIGSSTKQKLVAEKVRKGLKVLDADIQVWSDPGASPPSDTFIETLTEAARRADFAILIFGKDDVVISKGHKSFATRDNVVFEAGLFIGAISRRRTFIVRAKNAQIKILTDLAGVTLLDYKKIKQSVECRGACSQIVTLVKKHWVR